MCTDTAPVTEDEVVAAVVTHVLVLCVLRSVVSMRGEATEGGVQMQEEIVLRDVPSTSPPSTTLHSKLQSWALRALLGA